MVVCLGLWFLVCGVFVRCDFGFGAYLCLLFGLDCFCLVIYRFCFPAFGCLLLELCVRACGFVCWFGVFEGAVFLTEF